MPVPSKPQSAPASGFGDQPAAPIVVPLPNGTMNVPARAGAGRTEREQEERDGGGGAHMGSQICQQS